MEKDFLFHQAQTSEEEKVHPENQIKTIKYQYSRLYLI